MTSIPAAMLAEMRGLNRVVPTFEIDLVGTTYRFSPSSAAAFDGVGYHDPFLTSMDNFGTSGNFSDFTLELPRPTVELYDVDRTVQKLLGSAARGSVVGSPARCYRRSSPSVVAVGSHWKFFDGVVSSYGMSSDRNYRFELSPDTRVLDGQPKIPTLTRDDFPTCPADLVGTPLWIVFGTHVSAGVAGAKGMVQCLPSSVDANGECLDWIVSYGQATAVIRLFRGASQSAAVEDTANWGFYPLERGGRRYQMAHYSGGGPEPLATDYVAVDMSGLFQVGPVETANPAITNPSEAIRTFLSHFAYGSGDVRSSIDEWEPETGKPISGDAFDPAHIYFANRGDKCAMAIRSDEKVIDVFNRWCDNFNAGPFLEDGWKIGARPEDEAQTTIYYDDRNVLQSELSDGARLTMDNSRSRGVTRLTVNYLFADSIGQLVESRYVSDPGASVEVRDSIDLQYGRSEAF